MLKCAARLLIFLFVLLAASCATGVLRGGKSTRDSKRNNSFMYFPPGADIYLSFKPDFIKNTNFFKAGKTEKKFLSKTKVINAALYKNDYIVSLEGGSYPVVSSAFYFTFSSNWKKIKTKTANYWKYGRVGKKDFYLAVSRKKVFISSKSLFENTENAAMPASYPDFSGGSEGSGWFPSPSLFNMFLSAAGVSVRVPAREIFFAIFKNTYGYECTFRLEMPSAAAAKGIASLLIITRANLGDMTLLDASTRTVLDILFANPPRVKDNALYLTTGIMDMKDISSMLDFFLEHKQVF